MKMGECTHSKCQMPCDKEDRELEVEGIVHVVIINDDRRAEDDPDWDNERCFHIRRFRSLLLLLLVGGGGGRGDGRRQQGLIGVVEFELDTLARGEFFFRPGGVFGGHGFTSP